MEIVKHQKKKKKCQRLLDTNITKIQFDIVRPIEYNVMVRGDAYGIYDCKPSG